jgi:hypothetical protein
MAVETMAKSVEAGDRGLKATMSEFVAWAVRYGVDVNDAREARMELWFNGIVNLKERVSAIRERFNVWSETGID